ncbi:transglycosylase domain-containing protein [Actinotalea ferrariae]|uniref:transglycosylase domain-containing protein n=1 Tax=Actinotalea ferrariae TaxID=1386098 RepID=UPI001C8CC2C8|nr:transglycosylase domain-containing protein [Actinotalea ferrariae]MBX9244893.1 transglycosylase domain-containing protein [Actinotalea ferrariae]
MLGTFLTVAALVLGGFVYLYATTDIPEPNDFADAQTTVVYYSDGATPMGEFAEQNRTIIDGGTIPEHVKAAVVAAEDRSFYENPGINPAGIVRALWNNLRGGEQQGGSSITQQYAERYYFEDTVKDYRGKLKEALLAIKLDRAQDKDEILANYLNTIYFGRDSYGIEEAARAYFGVGAAELDVSQAAVIAGIIPSPNNWDPAVDPEKAESRWNYVLDGMIVTGALTEAEREALVFPTTIPYAPTDTFAGPQGYLLDMVRRELIDSGAFSQDELRMNGYRIVTTIDGGLQGVMQDVVAGMPADRAPELRVGMVTLNPADGSIVALYGGPDYLTQGQNSVTQARAQAGSTFKPFTLAAYLQNGGSLKSRYSGADDLEVEGFDRPVTNFGNASFGRIDVVEATAKSVNTVYAQMNVEVGPPETLRVAREAGIPEDQAAQDVPSNVLGVSSVAPLEMAQAYNTFAAGGVRYEPFVVRSVTHPDGVEAYTGGTAGEQVFPADVMADVTYAMTQVVESRGGTAREAAEVGHPVAGKTGTSSDNKSAWFVGFTRHLTTAVALYQPTPDGTGEAEITPFGGYDEITGGSVPLDVWTQYMTAAMGGREVLPFPERADVGEPNTPPLVEIPSVVGMGEPEARAALEGAGFAVGMEQANDASVPAGTVISQNPGGGGEAEQGSTVTIVVSAGPGTVAVPNVVGQTSAAAQSALGAAGLSPAVSTAPSATVPEGQVISQNPGAGAQVAPGSGVGIVVSSGPPDDGGDEEPPPPAGPGGGPPPSGGGDG